MRKQKSIEGSYLGDCVSGLFCTYCVLCQMFDHLENEQIAEDTLDTVEITVEQNTPETDLEQDHNSDVNVVPDTNSGCILS